MTDKGKDQEICPDCKGKGFILVLDDSLNGVDAAYDCPDSTWEPKYKQIDCLNCKNK